jgi:NAD(P)H-flavin reductase/ferredoxin
VQLKFEGRSFELQGGESVLECLDRHGAGVPSFCRSGVCQSCLVRAVAGNVPAAAQQGLKETWRTQGIFMACVCRPAGDMEVARCDAAPEWSAKIINVEPLSARVLRVDLSIPAGFDFSAGQFIQLIRPDGELMRPYSIASLPDERRLELHVALLPDGQMSQWLRTAAGADVRLRGPFGECVYVPGEQERPLLLVGTGTGLAPLLGIARTALQAQHKAPIHLLHGAADIDGLYMWQQLVALQQDNPLLCIAGSALGVTQDSRISGQPLQDQVLGGGLALADFRIYLCGNPEFVRSLRRQLYLAGSSLDRIHVDPFVAPAQIAA